jgi:farnesyl diphosphate synthase
MSLDPTFVKRCQERLNALFAQYLQDSPSSPLKSAMQYTLSNGGTRLRPLLIYATGHIFDAPLENCDIPAAAVELVHTYSLIHDDLPCMDNADLRRGKPTAHKVYGEGMAVLTGDALHTLAMQLIADHPAPLSAQKRVQMLSVLTRACGHAGMAGGQAMDITLLSEGKLPLDLLTTIYNLKTGALFSACIELGLLASNDKDTTNQRALREFGDCIGLAFQIQDDILDIETTTEALGKDSGIDLKNNKNTYPHIAGMATAKNKVQALYEQALESINYLGDKAQLLRDLTSQMLNRGY